MLTKTRHILNQTNKTSRPIKVLTWPTHESYQTLLSEIPNVEWHIFHNGGKTWDYHTKPLPKNTFLYFTNPQQIRGETCFDLILSQERGMQLPMSLNLGRQFGIPVIHLDHTEPYPNLSNKNLQNLKSLKADYHVSISEHNQKTWDTTGEIIRHGIDTNIFQLMPSIKNQKGINISNHFVGRDAFLNHVLFSQIAENEAIDVIGFNPETPKYHNPISDASKLVNLLNQYSYYINTTKLSPLPMSLLEAAACGMPIITTPYQEINTFFKNEENCLIATNKEEFLAGIKRLKTDQNLANKLGSNAREMILKNFSLERFINQWSTLLNKVYNDNSIR